jgi:predicted ArsR family transcriptional regulator
MSERTRDRILLQLKMRGATTAMALGERLELTPMAIRQHLANLKDEGLVTFREQKANVGRPARHWELTPKGEGRFPDTHADLTVELLRAMRESLGDDALREVVRTRYRKTLAQYRERVGQAATLDDRVRILARLRDGEGYMAAVEDCDDGSYLLVENHCPICAAATECQGFCEDELELFRHVLGASVTRESHVLAGARRCAYRVRRR